MQLEEVIKKRQATRFYLNQDVHDSLIEQILNLASLSSSAGNLQARRVVVVKDTAIKSQLKAKCNGLARFTQNPPIIFVICAVPEESAQKYGDRGRNLYALQDATIFAAYLQLAAVSEGLATCWVGSFSEKEVAETLDLPENLIPVALIPVGYSNDGFREKSRKSLAELIIKRI